MQPLGASDGILMVRLAAAPIAVDIVLAADPGAARDGRGEPRSPLPVPHRWRTEVSPGHETWELFNASLSSVMVRRN